MRNSSGIPAVSVGIPVYNGDNYLEEAIASILAQTFTDFELVISDNASTDRTEEICRRFAASDSRIRYFRQPKNLGATANFQFVIDAARARYFKWAAHDDVIAPTFLERCHEVLEADPGCILVYPRTMIIDEHSQPKFGYLDVLAVDSENAAVRFRPVLFPGTGEPNPFFGLLRRDIIRKSCPLGIYGGFDAVFLGYVVLTGRVRVINEPLFLRRLHPRVSVAMHFDCLSYEQFQSGQKSRGLRFKNLRILREFLRAVNTVPMTRSERFGCYKLLLREMWKVRVSIAKELAIPLYMNGRPTALGRWLYYTVKPTGKLRSDRLREMAQGGRADSAAG